MSMLKGRFIRSMSCKVNFAKDRDLYNGSCQLTKTKTDNVLI